MNKKDFKFDKRASKYDEGFEGRFSRRFYTALLSQVKLEKGFAVLDVGCGTGYLLRGMAGRQEINGFGIDVEPNMIEIAKRQCPGMTIQVSACERTPFEDGAFDVLTACMAYHHFADKPGFGREASRLLGTGGYLYIADPRFPFPVRKAINGVLSLMKIAGKFFTPQEIAFDFGAFGFDLTGIYHKGIVQVVALKKGGGKDG